MKFQWAEARALGSLCSYSKAGTVLLEMEGVTEEDAREALVLAGHKLPVHGKFIKKN